MVFMHHEEGRIDSQWNNRCISVVTHETIENKPLNKRQKGIRLLKNWTVPGKICVNLSAFEGTCSRAVSMTVSGNAIGN
jgi:hypothetical protein